MAYKVELAAEAEANLDAIYQWSARRWSAEQARLYLAGLKQAVLSLARLPKGHPLAPDQEAFEVEVRQALYGKHRILYTISGRSVVVLMIRHTAQRPLA